MISSAKDRRPHPAAQASAGAARPRREAIVQLLILGIGGVVIAAFVFGSTYSERQLSRARVLAQANQSIKVKVALSHLWLEEALSGDSDIDVAVDVYGNIDDALQLARAMIDEAHTSKGHIPRLEPGPARGDLTYVAAELDAWRDDARARLENVATTAAGTPLDQAYDNRFHDILRALDEAEDHIDGAAVRDAAALRSLKWATSGGVGFLFLTLAAVVRRHRRTLQANNAELAALAHIVESSDEAIYSTSLDGTITTWNPATERLYGYPSEEAVGRHISIIVPPDRRAEVEANLQKLSRGEPVDRMDTIRVRRGGEPVEVSVTVSPMLDASGTVIGASLIGRDISARKEAEAALAQARDEALGASRAKSDFLATMSHEIRTPMNGVIGLTGLLLDTDLTEVQRHHAEAVRASGESLLGIINDILDFSKIEAGKLELETVDFDLGGALEEVAALVAESARGKGLELVAYAHHDVPSTLRGDVGRLRQILLNYATNAIKFTAAGEVVLRACLAEKLNDEHVVVRFEVADTGVGVDPANADRLFEPFSQGDASTTRRYGGTGLGLAICRRLAEAMGGAVGVDGRPGQGSTFWLQLPLQHPSAPVSTPGRTNHSLEGRRLLVVEDNQTNRLVLVSQLGAWDIDADQAADAEEAMERLREAAAEYRPYDLALIDMAMPGMDGLELAGVIRADAQLTAVRLLLLSSVSIEPQAATAAGFVATLTKPVRLSSLYDALMRAVTSPSLGTGTEVAATPAVPVGARGTVLIVEDHAINQEVARGMVAKLGYGSDVAGDGIEALEALERRSYDAVLMDCHMPRMDGFQATAEIRRREAGQGHVPIIAMTAGALAEDREKCIAAGMDEYLSKPVKASELEAILRRRVTQNASRGDAPPSEPAAAGLDGDDVLDASQFDELRQLAASSGDAGFLRNVVDQYLEQAHSQAAELRAAAARGDAPALVGLAHGLKGASATMGASGVAAASAAVEMAAARGGLAGDLGVERVFVELERAAAALRAQAPTVPSSTSPPVP